jgi:signal transduction histidine kinase
MNAIRLFLDSAAGRIFLLLLLGITLAAFAAFAAADAAQRESFYRLRVEWTAQRVVDAVGFFNAATPSQRRGLLNTGLVGLRTAPQSEGERRPVDTEVTDRIRELTGAGQAIAVRTLDPSACVPEHLDNPPRAPTCWLIETTLNDGQLLRAIHLAPPPPSPYARLFDPIYLSVLAFASALLALAIAYLAAKPLDRLAQAATELGENIERAPLDLEGPAEVRAASQAFNAMQNRLKETLSERTRMLGAITHDLQTPLTRMRLRIERIGDTEIRDRLVDDLAAMQLLIKEGLDLARSADSAEDWSTLDLNALLETLVEDASEAGRNVRLASACAVDVRARPQALRRCLQNLIDNAVAYGGDAEVSCEIGNGSVTVRVRDHGPGVPEDQLERILEPFYRLESSRSRDTGGSGLGLTIARGLAAKNDASLKLRNHPEGGLEASVHFKTGSAMTLRTQ